MPSTAPSLFEKVYQFTQTSSRRYIEVNFTIPTGVSALFRAEIGYDFEWNDLSLLLRTSTGTILAQGVIGFNREEIPTTTLVPGVYFLRIYNPFSTERKACVSFLLTVALQAQIAGGGFDLDVMEQCPHDTFPATLNSVPYLHNLSGDIVHFSRYVLVDVVNRRDYVDFTVDVPSSFRIYIPHNPEVDVDFYFKHGTSANPGYPIVQRIGLSEETYQGHLDPGAYVLQFNYYALTGGPPIPPASECLSFPVVITIYPEAVLKAMTPVSTTCSARTPPTQIVSSAPFHGTFQRPLDVSGFRTSLTFTVSQPSLFITSLRYADYALGLNMRLHGQLLTRVNKYVFANY